MHKDDATRVSWAHILRRIGAVLGLCIAARAMAEDVPAGVHALTQALRPVPEAVLSHTAVVAVVLRSQWRDVEPQEGHFDWRYFDEQMQRVVSAGKLVSLVVTAGGLATPDWLAERVGERFRFTDKVRFHETFGAELAIPVFWDPALIAAKKRLIAAMGERYAKMSALRLVSVQCANATTDDWNIPGEEAVATWKRLGFTEARMLDACSSLIDATAQAFPGQALRMAVGPVPRGLTTDREGLARDLARYGTSRYPGRFYVQRHNLSARTPRPGDPRGVGWEVVAKACPACAAQFLWPASDTRSCRANGGQAPCDAPTVFRAAADTALAYKLRYVEVYGADLLDQGLAEEVDRLARGLGSKLILEGKQNRTIAPGPVVLALDRREVEMPMRERAPRSGPEIAGIQHLSFPSKAYGGPRSYSIWLPDSYASSERRYPVLYWLHGKGGDPRRSSRIAGYLKREIDYGRMPETIMVFPDGDSDRFYTDGPNGQAPVETMIIDELIPYIDSHYRTVADRRGRMIEGFSMGGFGALKFAAKYPELFASVVALGAPRLDAEQGMGGPDARIFEEVFAGDRERFRRNTPSWLFRTNRERIVAAGLRIRLEAGSADGTRHSVQKLHEVLDELVIPHEYAILDGVRHAPGIYYEADGGAGFALHSKALRAN